MNFSQFAPKEPVSPLLWMPNHDENSGPAKPEFDEATTQRMGDYAQMLLDVAARQRQEAEARGERIP